MHVTSDIYDLARLEAGYGHWRERLFCGVAASGPNWPGPAAAARFLLEAVAICGLDKAIEVGGYDIAGESHTRVIQPRSVERIAQRKLKGAQAAEVVSLTGLSLEAEATNRSVVRVGGEVGIAPVGRDQPRPRDAFTSCIIFPFDEGAERCSADILTLAVTRLGAAYGYAFLRDGACTPEGFALGLSAAVAFSQADPHDRWHAEAEEISGWAIFQASAWDQPTPVLRDVFGLNLISTSYAAPDDSGRTLIDWIAASSGRGTVHALGDGRALWTLTDVQQVNVRPILNRAGQLFACRDRIYRGLEPVAPQLH